MTAPSSLALLTSTAAVHGPRKLLDAIAGSATAHDAAIACADADGIEVCCQLLAEDGDGTAIVYLFGGDDDLDIRLAETIEWSHRTARQPRWLIVVTVGPASGSRRLDLEIIRAATSGCRWALVASRGVYAGDDELRAALNAHGALDIFLTDAHDDAARDGVARWLDTLSQIG
jgi:hypothetical protein